MRDSMVLYRSFTEAMDDLPAEQYKEAMQAITKYAMDGIEPECSGVIKAIFLISKPQIDRGLHFLDGQNCRHSAEYVNWRKMSSKEMITPASFVERLVAD